MGSAAAGDRAGTLTTIRPLLSTRNWGLIIIPVFQGTITPPNCSRYSLHTTCRRHTTDSRTGYSSYVTIRTDDDRRPRNHVSSRITTVASRMCRAACAVPPHKGLYTWVETIVSGEAHAICLGHILPHKAECDRCHSTEGCKCHPFPKTLERGLERL